MCHMFKKAIIIEQDGRAVFKHNMVACLTCPLRNLTISKYGDTCLGMTKIHENGEISSSLSITIGKNVQNVQLMTSRTICYLCIFQKRQHKSAKGCNSGVSLQKTRWLATKIQFTPWLETEISETLTIHRLRNRRCFDSQNLPWLLLQIAKIHKASIEKRYSLFQFKHKLEDYSHELKQCD